MIEMIYPIHYLIHNNKARYCSNVDVVTKDARKDIVITVGIQFWVGFGGFQNAVSRKRVVRYGWVEKTLKSHG